MKISPPDRLGFLLFFIIAAAAVDAWGQQQLILLRKEQVMLRLFPGDEIVFRLRGARGITTTYVNNLSDTAVITHRDTVPFHTIDKIYFSRSRFYNRVGTALVILGAGLFLIDQVNLVVVNGQPPGLDAGISKVSVASLATGLPLMLIRQKGQKLNYTHRLMTVDKGSVFYRPDTRENILPFTDR